MFNLGNFFKNPKVVQNTIKATRVAAVTLVSAATLYVVPWSQESERLVLAAYKDSVGYYTWCYGDIYKEDGSRVKAGDVATSEYCDERSKKRLLKMNEDVAKLIKVDLDATDGHKLLGAHAHFADNVGLPTYKASSILRLTNAGDLQGGCRAVLRYDVLRFNRGTPNEVVVHCSNPAMQARYGKQGCNGIMNRRNKEVARCLEGAK